MGQFANVDDFCPNEKCKDFGKLQEKQSKRNIKKSRHTKNGTQRYQCLTCKKTFTATKGTISYRRRTPMREILEVLAFLVEGVRISTLVRVKGHKEDMILELLKEATQHIGQIEALLLTNYQLDAMWSYVGNKGEKKTTRRQKRTDSFGVRP